MFLTANSQFCLYSEEVIPIKSLIFISFIFSQTPNSLVNWLPSIPNCLFPKNNSVYLQFV